MRYLVCHVSQIVKKAEFCDIKIWGTNLKWGVQHAVLRKKLYFFLLTMNDFVTKKNC